MQSVATFGSIKISPILGLYTSYIMFEPFLENTGKHHNYIVAIIGNFWAI